MASPSRRNVLSALGTGAAALAVARETLGQAPVPAPAPAPAPAAVDARPPAYRGQHQPQPLPFDPTKLPGLSEKLLRSHWENNYGGAVKALNAIELRLDALMRDKDLPAYVYGDLKREELLRTGSVVLHEHYFANLGGDGKASGPALDLLKRDFGAYEGWEAEFRRTAMALAGGSGWAILALNLHTGEAHNYWAADHAHNAALGAPLLVLDMYEHAFHIDYGAAAARYVDAFMANVDWAEVSRRAEWARRAVRV